MRKNISTNTPSEKRVGYSRAVRINNRIYFSGTTSMDEKGDVVGKSLYELIEIECIAEQEKWV